MKRYLALMLAAGLLLAACGDDDEPASAEESSSADTSASTAGAIAPAGSTEPPDTADVGGDDQASAVPTETGPADQSLDPVVVGWMNIDAGTVSYPASTDGFLTAVEYINDNLGGIDGHPIVVESCDVALDDASIQQCAQQFANNDEVNLVAQGYVISAGGPQFPIFEAVGMPVAIMTALQQTEMNAQTGVSLFPGNPGISGALPVFLAEFQGAKTIAAITSDNDAGRSAYELIKQAVETNPQTADVTMQAVRVQDDEVDYSAPLRAAGLDDADAVLALMAEPGCIQVANALDTLNIEIPVVTNNGCAADPVVEAVGDKIDGWYIAFGGVPPQAGEGVDPEIDLYIDVMAEYGKDKSALGTNAPHAFGMAISLWEIGNEIGAENLTKEGWLEGMQSFTGPVFLGPRSTSCPGPVFPTVCGGQVQVYQYSDGTFTDATDGQGVIAFSE